MSSGLSLFRKQALLALLTVALAPTAMHAQTDAVSWVNPYIGTGSGPIGYGGTMPFVSRPLA